MPKRPAKSPARTRPDAAPKTPPPATKIAPADANATIGVGALGGMVVTLVGLIYYLHNDSNHTSNGFNLMDGHRWRNFIIGTVALTATANLALMLPGVGEFAEKLPGWLKKFGFAVCVLVIGMQTIGGKTFLALFAAGCLFGAYAKMNTTTEPVATTSPTPAMGTPVSPYSPTRPIEELHVAGEPLKVSVRYSGRASWVGIYPSNETTYLPCWKHCKKNSDGTPCYAYLHAESFAAAIFGGDKVGEIVWETSNKDINSVVKIIVFSSSGSPLQTICTKEVNSKKQIDTKRLAFAHAQQQQLQVQQMLAAVANADNDAAVTQAATAKESGCCIM